MISRSRGAFPVSIALAAAPLLTSATPSVAQQGSERQQLEARVLELEEQVSVSQPSASLYAELQHLRGRLADGDFRAGDAVALIVVGEVGLTDTFQVREPRVLELPEMEPIDLTGVLRDEIHERLEPELKRYLRDPEFMVYPLIRVGVTGAVSAPGYYLFRPDVRLIDMFGSAGGFKQDANTTGIVLRRAGQPVVASDEFSQAMAAGLALEQLPYQPNDEVFVPSSNARALRDWVWIIGGALGIVYTVMRIANF